MGSRNGRSILWGMAAVLIAANAWAGGGVHPAAGNPHPAAGNPHPARFANPHPAAPPSVAAAPHFGGQPAATTSGFQNRVPNEAMGVPVPVVPPAQPQTGGNFHYLYVGDRGVPTGPHGAAPTIRGFAPNPVTGFTPSPVTGFSSSPVTGFSPSPVKGFISPPLNNCNPPRDRFDCDRKHFRRPHPPTGFAGGLEPFPAWPGFTPSVPGPMADDLRELIADENGMRVYRLHIPPGGETAAAAESDLVKEETLNTAAPQSGF